MITYLVIISTLIGAVIQINMIGSRAFLVSQMEPIVAVYTGIIAGLLSTIFFKYLSSPKIKFAKYAFSLTALHAVVFFLLSLRIINDYALAISWITLAAFSMGLCRWLTIEMAHKYLDPARSQSFFAYLSSFLGLGFIISFLLLRVFKITLGPTQTLIVTSSIFAAIAILVAFGFFPKNVIEINFDKKSSGKNELTTKHDSNIKFHFAALCFFLGGMKVIFSYLINIQLKANLNGFTEINEMVINYTVISSVLIIITGITLGKFISKKRLSPINVMYVANTILLIMSTLCLFIGKFELFITLEIFQKFIDQGIQGPSLQQILNSFINNHKKSLRSIQQFFYYTLTGPILGALFYFTKKLDIVTETNILLGTLISFTLFNILSIRNFHLNFREVLYDYINSNILSAKILSSQMLSFLKPKDYVDLMKKELDKDQKNYLRKTIIIGLGYTGKLKSTEIIKSQFKHEKEEVQIAVLEALSTAQRFEGVSFIMDILNMKVLPKSFQVRVNATKIIARLYDTKAIPLILVGLSHEDDRVVANVLETLSVFKNENLIRYFIRFSNHETARVKANALMGCYKYKQTRPLYNQIISDIFSANESKYLPSIFYVIGYLRDKNFKNQLLEIANQEFEKIPEHYRASLAFALINIGEMKGHELAAKCFFKPYEQNKEISFTHFLSQLDRVQRFDFIKNSFNISGAPEMIAPHLANSRFDFHEEVDYLEILSEATAA